MKKLKELDAKGFSHHIVMVAFVLIFSIAGVAYLVAGHAQTNKQAQAKAKLAKQKQAQQKKTPPKLDPQPLTPQPISDGTSDDGTSTTASASGAGGTGTSKPNIRENIRITTQNQLGNGNVYKGPAGLWCASFATWVWQFVGINIPRYTSASQIRSWGIANKKWHTSKPRVGDIAVYGTVHVGIVVSSDGVNVKMIDGNWGDRVSYHLSGTTNGGPLKAPYHDFYTSGQRVSGFVSP